MGQFDLGPDPGAQPLPMSSQAQPKDDRRKWLQFAMLMAAAAKGGPGATEGVLHGMQQAGLLRDQRARQSQQDAMAQERFDSEQAFRQDTQADRELQRRQGFLNQFQSGLGTLEDQAAIDAYLKLHQGQAQAFGVNPADLQTYASSLMPPSKLQKKAAESYIGKLKATYGNEWMQQAGQFGTHNVKGENLTLEEVLRRAELPGVAEPAAKPNLVNPGSFEEYVNLPPDQQALRRKQRQEFMQADDSPPDPQLADINRQLAQARLDNLRAAKGTEGLPPRIQRQIDAQARGFDMQPSTKTTQVIAQAADFVNSLDINTKNPADDQALIYAYAKAQDPDSVVREGEYATVQKYAQSWAEQFGFNVARVFSNTHFLTPQARQNMKTNIMAKYAAARRAYDNVRSQYAKRIDRITGGTDGDSYLIDYAGAFPDAGRPSVPVTETSGAEWVTLGDGTRVRVKSR
jgi:hypothetical protein